MKRNSNTILLCFMSSNKLAKFVICGRMEYFTALYLAFIMLLFVVALWAISLTSCGKDEMNYHRNDLDVYFYNMSGDAFMLHVNGTAKDLKPHDTVFRAANSSGYAWYGYTYRIYLVINNRETEKFVSDTKRFNWVYHDHVKSSDF